MTGMKTFSESSFDLMAEAVDRLDHVESWSGWREPTARGELHHVPTVVIPIGGDIRISRGNIRHLLRVGSALIIGPGVWHAHEKAPSGAAVWKQGWMPGGSDVELCRPDGVDYGMLPKQPFLRWVEEALRCVDQADRRLALMRKFCRQAVRQHIVKRREHTPPVRRMLRHLWSRLTKGVTASDLVAASGIGRSQAYRLFAEDYGCSPQQAILAARTELAVSLRKAGLSAGAAASCAGFRDQRALARRLRLQSR